MKINENDKKVFSEVTAIINILDNIKKERIPIELRKFLDENKDDEYSKKINIYELIEEKQLQYETYVWIATLNLNYLCTDINEKDKLIENYEDNQEKYDEFSKVKVDFDQIFNKNKSAIEEKIEEKEECNKIITIKNESLFYNLINKIKEIINKWKNK